MTPEILLVERLMADNEKLSAQVDDLEKLLNRAWGLLANVGGGDWAKCAAEWRREAIRWRTAYYKHNESKLKGNVNGD